MLKTFITDESGAALVEYGLLVGLIAVIAIGAVQLLGTHIRAVFDDVNGALSSSGL